MQSLPNTKLVALRANPPPQTGWVITKNPPPRRGCVRFNKTPRVELGLKRLRRYRRKFNDALQAYTAAEHDENSHGADAFGEYAIDCGIWPPAAPKPKPKINTRQPTIDELLKEYDREKRFIGNRI